MRNPDFPDGMLNAPPQVRQPNNAPTASAMMKRFIVKSPYTNRHASLYVHEIVPILFRRYLRNIIYFVAFTRVIVTATILIPMSPVVTQDAVR